MWILDSNGKKNCHSLNKKEDIKNRVTTYRVQKLFDGVRSLDLKEVKRVGMTG